MISRFAAIAFGLVILTGCAAGQRLADNPNANDTTEMVSGSPAYLETEDTVWSIFARPSTENRVLVNRYIWNASLEVLNFMPIQTVDPFTGVIVTGYGTPPGGGRSYRATVLIDDPALAARSLNVSLQTRNGRSADPATVHAVENAILSRARQLRIADNAF